MPGDGSEQIVNGLILACAACGSRCRLRSGSKKKPPCPRCGGTLHPAPLKSNVSGGMKPPRSRPTDDDESDGQPYAAGLPDQIRAFEAPEPDEIENVEIRRKRPRVPSHPLWQGVCGFPWHAGSLRPWFLFGIGLSLISLLGGGLHYVIDLYLASDLGASGIWRMVFTLFMKAFVLCLLWTGSFAAGFFLSTIEDTAAGNDKVTGPDNSLGEKLFTFLRLCWIFFCSAIPFGIVAVPLKMFFGYRVFGWSLVPTTIFVFPPVLMCALANDSRLNFWHAELLGNLLRRPGVLGILWLMSTLLLAPCILLGHLTIIEYDLFIFLFPLTGFVWSACLLIHARLLGRVGWVISGDYESARRESRRNRKRD